MTVKNPKTVQVTLCTMIVSMKNILDIHVLIALQYIDRDIITLYQLLFVSGCNNVKSSDNDNNITIANTWKG